MIQPKITVIMPAYNAENYIKDAINSILKQTLRPMEILVVNDGSTDKTRKIIGNWSLKEPLVKLITQEHEGIGSARKRGVGLARGDFITFLSVDDTWESEFLKKTYDFWKEQTPIDNKKIVYTYWKRCAEQMYELVDIKCQEGNNNIIAKAPDCIVMFDTLFMSKDVFKEVNFDENAKVGEDMIFVLETIKKGYQYILLKETLARYRVHDKQMSGKWTQEEYNYHAVKVEKLKREIRGV